MFSDDPAKLMKKVWKVNTFVSFREVALFSENRDVLRMMKEA